MSTLSLAGIAACLGLPSVVHDIPVTSVVIDSRQVSEGALFVAFVGESVDGHDYLQDAYAKGAVAALVSRPCPDSPIPVLQVPDTAQALGQLAAWWRSQLSDCSVVAITGSCGKTTTKQIVTQLLATQGKTHSTKGNQNNELGVPLTLLGLRPEHRYAVIEMGAGAPGDIAYLSEMAQPHVTVITTIAEAHLDGLGDINGIAHAKAEISRGLLPDGTLVLNRDVAASNIAAQQKKPAHRLLWFGCSPDGDISASGIHASPEGVRACVHMPDGCDYDVRSPLLGAHNMGNIMAAMAVAHALGMAPSEMLAVLAKQGAHACRLQLQKGWRGATVIDDAYNANPTAVKAAIATLASFEGKRKVLVMGGMHALGDVAPARHQEVGLCAKQAGIDALYAVGDLCVPMVQAFGEGGEHFATQDALIAALKDRVDENDVVLIKGSHVTAMHVVVAALCDEQQKG